MAQRTKRKSVADKSRNFIEVAVDATGAQTPPAALGGDIAEALSPQAAAHIRPYRNNLTALSHVYNLFFLAKPNGIHVYQPSFPAQRLSDQAELVLEPPISSGALRVQQDTPEHEQTDLDYPHSINHLIVDFLGNEEIVLVACADGDVLGYKTKPIHDYLSQQDELKRNGHGFAEPTPFFHANVRASAWGLSVHREARMIAVSANTTRITIFAFALTSEDEQSMINTPDLDTGDDQDDPSDWPLPRAKNHRFELDCSDRFHTMNQPCVAFCNTGEDPAGRWLLSGDIGSYTILWDLHKKAYVRGMLARFCDGTAGSRSVCRCRVRSRWYYHGVWSLFWLDRRSFRAVGSIREACGCSEKTPFHIDSMYWNNTCSKREVRDIDLAERLDELGSILQEEFDDDDYDEAAEGSDHHFVVEEHLEDSDDDLEELQHATALPDLESANSEESSEGSADYDEDDLGSLAVIEVGPGQIAFSPQSPQERRRHPLSEPRNPTFTTWVAGFEPRDDQLEAPQTQPVSADEAPSCPILLTSGKDIFLTQSPSLRPHPVTCLHGALDQPPTSSTDALFGNQLKLSAYIPELGVLALGNPAGYVAIISLTSVEAEEGTQYSFRLEHKLPFRMQVQQRIKPLYGMLCGLAVGPVQGHLGAAPAHAPFPARRRWRLMLTYRDRTVLSYVLGKPRNAGSAEDLDCFPV